MKKSINTSFEKSIEVNFNKSKIFLLHFYDAYDVNMYEKKYANVFIEFHHFMNL